VGLGRSRRSRDGVRRHIETTELPGAAAGRGLIERHVDRVIVRPQAVEVRLKSSRMTEPAEAASDASMVPIGMIDRINATTREARLSARPPSIISVCTKLHIRPASSVVSSIVTLGIQASANVGLSRSSAHVSTSSFS
jgi:hypothetical protein